MADVSAQIGTSPRPATASTAHSDPLRCALHQLQHVGAVVAPALRRLRPRSASPEAGSSSASQQRSRRRAPRLGVLPVSAFSAQTERALALSNALLDGQSLDRTSFQLPPRRLLRLQSPSAAALPHTAAVHDGTLHFDLEGGAAELSPVELARSGSVPTLFLGNVYTNGAVNTMGVQKMQRLVEDMFHSLVHARNVPTVELLLRALPSISSHPRKLLCSSRTRT